MNIIDPTISKMQDAGFDIDQSSNNVVYYWGSAFPGGVLTPDNTGNITDEIAMAPILERAPVGFFSYDSVGNFNQGGPYMHNFVKEGTPYSTVSSNKKEITVDEEVEFTLTAHNVEMLQEANFQLNYDKQQLQLVDVKLHEDVESYGDPTITYSEESISNTRNNISISTAINDIEQEVTGDIPIAVATFTGKEADFGRNNYVKNPTLSTTYTNTQEETTNLRGYYEGQNTELLRNYSEVRGNILAQGFFGLDGQYDSSQEFPNASIQMQATDAEGNKYDATIENDNDFTIQVPVTDETFDLEVKIPGSFPSPYNF